MWRKLMLALTACLAPLFAAAAEPPPSGNAAALAGAAADLCGKRIALLGENGYHGDGRTPEFKVQLIRRLVSRCGFNAVFFEASHYDFVAIGRHARRHERVTPDMVSSAIGWIWNHDAELAPLFPFLAGGAESGRLTLGGLDDQLGARDAFYSLDTMPNELTLFLAEPRRSDCRARLHQRLYGSYPSDSPHNAENVARLQQCVREIGAAVAAEPRTDSATRAEYLDMIDNIERCLAREFVDTPSLVQGRDRSMFLNFRRMAQRLPRGAKIIVWAENHHIVKDPRGDPNYAQGNDLGGYIHQTYGRSAFALGFTAAGGTFRWSKRENRQIPPAPPGSLEALALANKPADIRYLGPVRLAGIGTVLGGALKDHEYVPAHWADLYDGMIVFRTERPPVRLDDQQASSNER